MQIFQSYTAAVAGATVTLTAKTPLEPHPSHLGMSTIVITTAAGTAPPDFWKASATDGSEYEVIIWRHTKE